jgi:hypothetical protein
VIRRPRTVLPGKWLAMKSYIVLVALGLFVCTEEPTDMTSPNATSLPLDAMRHRQPTQSTVEERQQQRLGEALPAERARRQTDNVERLYQKLIGSPPSRRD